MQILYVKKITLKVFPSTISVTSKSLSEHLNAFRPCSRASECDVNIKLGCCVREYGDVVLLLSPFITAEELVRCSELLRKIEAAPPAIIAHKKQVLLNKIW